MYFFQVFILPKIPFDFDQCKTFYINKLFIKYFFNLYRASKLNLSFYKCKFFKFQNGFKILFLFEMKYKSCTPV